MKFRDGRVLLRLLLSDGSEAWIRPERVRRAVGDGGGLEGRLEELAGKLDELLDVLKRLAGSVEAFANAVGRAIELKEGRGG